DSVAPGLAAVAGHSLGGALAQRYALAYPERVASLVLSSSFARLVTPRSQWRARYIEQPAVLAALRVLPEEHALDFAGRLAALARRRPPPPALQRGMVREYGRGMDGARDVDVTGGEGAARIPAAAQSRAARSP